MIFESIIGTAMYYDIRQENVDEGFSNILNLFKKPTMRTKTLILYYQVNFLICFKYFCEALINPFPN